MSAAVMSSALYDFGDMVMKQQQVSLHQILGSSSGSSSGTSSSASSCSSGDVSKLDWESGAGSPPRPHSLAPFIFEDLLSTSHRRLERTRSEPAPSTIKNTSPINVNTSRYKTELCRPYEESGTCKYGDKCQFAHGEQELRGLVRHPKYKTEPCRTFHTVGFCPYGPRCHFIHNADEARRGSPPPRRAVSPSPSPPYSSPPYTPPPTSPPPNHQQPPLSPEARLPVFNRISAPPTPVYNVRFGELLA